MTSKSKIISATLTVSLASLVCASVQASDEPEVERLKVAGTFLTSRMDANADGEAASWCTIQIRGGYQGSSMQQCINEDVFVGVTADCPGGYIVVNSEAGGTGVGTRTFPNGEDQIYIQLTEREFCANEFGQVAGQDSGVIVGGVGRYEGATGTYEFEYSGQLQYFDPLATPPQMFGAVIGTGTWTIFRAD